MRRSIIFVLALLMSSSQAFAQKTSPFEMDPPIAIEESRAYGDGGTLALLLADAEGRRLWVVASGDGWDEQVPPDGTLFLDAGHHRGMSARLPTTSEEHERVVELLRSSTANEDMRREAEVDSDSAAAWDLQIAASILRKFEDAPESIYSEDAGAEPPQWYAEYDEQRRRKHAERMAEIRADERFKGFYPEAGRDCFEAPDDERGMVTFGAEDRGGPADAVDADESDEDRTLRRKAERLAEAVGDSVKLAEITCRAFGSIGGHPGHFVYRDFVAERAMRTVKPTDFVAALPRIMGDREAMLGAGRVLFEMGYDDELSEDDWNRWTPLIAEVALTDGPDDRKHEIARWIAERDSETATRLLLDIARGEVGSEPAVDEDDWSEEPGLSASAYLGLALLGEVSIREEVLEEIRTESTEENRAALEVCLALLGDPSYIKAEHFEIDSSSIGFAALRAIQRYEGRQGMDILMSAALDHRHAVVANEAMSVAEWLTGQQWQPSGSHSQARNFKEKAKAWWAKYGEDFKQRKLDEARH